MKTTTSAIPRQEPRLTEPPFGSHARILHDRWLQMMTNALYQPRPIVYSCPEHVFIHDQPKQHTKEDGDGSYFTSDDWVNRLTIDDVIMLLNAGVPLRVPRVQRTMYLNDTFVSRDA